MSNWFRDAAFGLFVHWGPYSEYGRGEQVLFREHLDPRQYEVAACRWNPTRFDAKEIAETAVSAGCRYAVLTTRHHDGYCLWQSKQTNYGSAAQAPKRDFVGEYVAACHSAGLKTGLYYSLADWRIAAYWAGAQKDPNGWAAFREYVHQQLRELLTNYGRIDVLWFDGAWPHTAEDWQAQKIVEFARELQPGILINNRLDMGGGAHDDVESAGASQSLGDFGTPEHHITADPNRMWESCQVSTWRLWGYTHGERWRDTDVLLDMLVQCANRGGNLLLNVGPDGEGRIPEPFKKRAKQIGDWLQLHGEAIYGSEGGVDITDAVTYGYQTKRGNNLYLIIRFWDGLGEMTIAGLASKVTGARLLTTSTDLPFAQNDDKLVIKSLPRQSPTDLFPVIKLTFDEPPKALPWARERLWSGDPARMIPWALSRGEGFDAAHENFNSP